MLQQQTHEAVIVELAPRPGLLTAVSNTLAVLPHTWGVSIVHGEQVDAACLATQHRLFDAMQAGRLKLRHLQEVSATAWTQATMGASVPQVPGKRWYNQLLASRAFWTAFRVDWILLFEVDAALCAIPTTTLDSFLHAYDFVGALWPSAWCERWWRRERNTLSLPRWNASGLHQCSGNSGLSLWRRELMVQTVTSLGHTYGRMQ